MGSGMSRSKATRACPPPPPKPATAQADVVSARPKTVLRPTTQACSQASTRPNTQSRPCTQAAKLGRAGATHLQRRDTEYSQATTRPNTEFRPPPQSGNPEVQVLAAARPAAWEVAPHEQKLEANGEVFIPFRVAKTKVSEVENDMRTLRSKHMKIIEQVEGQYKVRAHMPVRVRVPVPMSVCACVCVSVCVCVCVCVCVSLAVSACLCVSVWRVSVCVDKVVLECKHPCAPASLTHHFLARKLLASRSSTIWPT